ncbi:MAG: FHA domain-containing protein [Kiritimatiellae bacterium]|nr:FHA domain-containing protein [Kiritimatiellia bacterium]
MEMTDNDATLFGNCAASRPRDNSLLGNVLAIGSRLVAEGRLPKDVADGEPGAFALCLVSRDGFEVRALHRGDDLEVGRAPEGCAILWAVGDPWMSRRHFRVTVDADGVATLRCQGARNGTFVNDAAIDGGAQLRRGDVVRAGCSSFLLV